MSLNTFCIAPIGCSIRSASAFFDDGPFRRHELIEQHVVLLEPIVQLARSTQDPRYAPRQSNRLAPASLPVVSLGVYRTIAVCIPWTCPSRRNAKTNPILTQLRILRVGGRQPSAASLGGTAGSSFRLAPTALPIRQTAISSSATSTSEAAHLQTRPEQRGCCTSSSKRSLNVGRAQEIARSSRDSMKSIRRTPNRRTKHSAAHSRCCRAHASQRSLANGRSPALPAN